MPNWVSNSLIIEGSADTIKAIKEQLARPILDKSKDYQTGEVKETVITPVMSFRNIIFVPDDKIDLYHETNGSTRDEATGEMIRTGDTEWNWYNFNNREWGTKWDIHNEVFLAEDKPDSLIYSFDTAWSPPCEAILRLSEQYPEAKITLDYEEEQGWGGSILFTNGGHTQIEEYDIPSSHAEMIKRRGECYCSPPDFPFSDCMVKA
jgi:hypothetical protein